MGIEVPKNRVDLSFQEQSSLMNERGIEIYDVFGELNRQCIAGAPGVTCKKPFWNFETTNQPHTNQMEKSKTEKAHRPEQEPKSVLAHKSDQTSKAEQAPKTERVSEKDSNRLPRDVFRSNLNPGKHGSLTDRIIDSISSHEGGFTSINNNDAGYGISVGIRQWNQKSGELPNLIRTWYDKHPAKFKQIFGTYAERLLDEKWVRSYEMAHDRPFMYAMKNALVDKDFQRVQLEDARKFVVKTTELALKYGFRSEFGVALVCDMVNQLGPTGTHRALARCGIKKNNERIQNEEEAVLRISRIRPDGKRFHNLLAQRFSPSLPRMTFLA